MDDLQRKELAERLRALAAKEFSTGCISIDDDAEVDIITDDNGNPTGKGWVLARVYVLSNFLEEEADIDSVCAILSKYNRPVDRDRIRKMLDL